MEKEEKTSNNIKFIVLIGIILLVVIGLLSNSRATGDLKTIEKGKGVSLDLASTLAEEEITADLSEYKNSTSKINIYMFRGKGCSHCREFLTYIASIVKDYGKYFNLESFEVWNNKDNSSLMTEAATVFGEKDKADGVPYIIIGDKTFIGYASGYESQIKKAIVDLYNSKEKYDLFNAYKEKESNS